MSSEHNKQAITSLLEEPSRGNLAVVDDALAPGFLAHMVLGELEGRDSYRQYLASVRKAFPDMTVRINHIVAEDDSVAVRFTFTGTNTGELMGMPPTGRKVVNTEAFFMTFTGGLAAEAWQLTDSLSFYKQLGIDPPGM